MSGNPIIRRNARKDPSYCPYCMRCPGLVRMRKVATFYWRCTCGAVHDERPCLSEAAVLAEDVARLDQEEPGWDAGARRAEAESVLAAGMDPAIVAAIYGKPGPP